VIGIDRSALVTRKSRAVRIAPSAGTRLPAESSITSPGTWRGLRVRFPRNIASHSTEQEFYFGPDFLLRRHDYRLEIAGGTPIAQYVHDIIDADGFRFPSRRRAFPRGPGSKPIRDLLLISIDLSDFHVEKSAR
jgi:hypothetical protein